LDLAREGSQAADHQLGLFEDIVDEDVKALL